MDSRCCYKTRISFDINGRIKCEDFLWGHIDPETSSCQISVCNDGQQYVGSTNMCVNGRCNLFGCNCDSDCIGGSDTDAVESFKNRLGSVVSNVRRA